MSNKECAVQAWNPGEGLGCREVWRVDPKEGARLLMESVGR